MVMLQTVIRPSMESARIAGPTYSITWPVPPAVPIAPMMARIMSLAATPGGRSPLTWMRMLRGRFWLSVWVASTCSTSLEPIPKARQPKAPCVAVWLSPQTSVAPGRVTPCSGPMMWTMPWRASVSGIRGTPKRAQFSISASTWLRPRGSSMPATPAARFLVGIEWSGTATVASARRTPRPSSAMRSKPVQLVTSWIRCLSI